MNPEQIMRELFNVQARPKDEKGRQRRPVVMVDFESIEQMLTLKPSDENLRQVTTGAGPGVDSARKEMCLFMGEKEAKAADPMRGWRGGVSSLEEFGKLIHGGWKDGAGRMSERVSDVSVPRVQSIRRRKVYGADGDEVNIHRVYSGDLDHAWETTERRLVSGNSRNARIWVAGAFDAHTDSDKFFWRGAVACALTDALEEAGYRVEVMGYDQTTNSFQDEAGRSLDFVCRYPVKGFMEPLDIPRMAAVTAHAGFLRTMLFAVMMSAPYQVVSGFGHSNHARPDYAGEDDIVIDGMTSQYEAVEFIRLTMEKYKLEQ